MRRYYLEGDRARWGNDQSSLYRDDDTGTWQNSRRLEVGGRTYGEPAIVGASEGEVHNTVTAVRSSAHTRHVGG